MLDFMIIGLSVGPDVTRRLMEEIQRAAGW